MHLWRPALSSVQGAIQKIEPATEFWQQSGENHWTEKNNNVHIPCSSGHETSIEQKN